MPTRALEKGTKDLYPSNNQHAYQGVGGVQNEGDFVQNCAAGSCPGTSVEAGGVSEDDDPDE
jgi:hypothetical protein